MKVRKVKIQNSDVSGFWLCSIEIPLRLNFVFTCTKVIIQRLSDIEALQLERNISRTQILAVYLTNLNFLVNFTSKQLLQLVKLWVRISLQIQYWASKPLCGFKGEPFWASSSKVVCRSWSKKGRSHCKGQKVQNFHYFCQILKSQLKKIKY